MAENINISFAPNKSASESQRIADLEQYVSTLTERTKFAFASIIEEYNGADTDKTQQILNTIYQSTSESGSDVGQFTNEDQNSEIFNDYSGNTAGGRYAHAEGKSAQATGYASHAEGESCIASGNYSHAGGLSSEASGKCSYAGGELCTASGNHSHAEGWLSIASGECSYAMGKDNTITGGDYDTIIGNGNTIKNVLSNSEKGYQGTRYGQGSVVTGTSNTTVQSVNTLVSGRNNYVGRSYWNPAIDSLVVGSSNKINGGMDSSAVIGNANTTPSSENTDIISLSGSIVVGNENKIESGDIVTSTIIGDGNNAKLRVTAENVKNSMQNSVIIGTGNTNESVQGAYTIGHFNHQYSGSSAIITGKGQFAIGVGLNNGRPNNFVMGYYNKKYENGKELDLPFSFGGGTSDDDRKNLIELDWNGNLWIAGNLNEGGGGYVLPIATKSTLGGVMIGDNISVADDGTISVDLSSYLKSADISDWAKQSDKPTYTASEIGLGNVDNTADADKPISTATQTALDGKADTGHTHTVSDITDMPAYLTEETDPTVPAWAKAESKPVYTAEEVGAVTAEDMDAKTYLKAVDITGQTVDLNDYKLNQPADKGKSLRHFCSVASSENITNRPVSVNEPFELVTTNIRYVSTGAYHTVQKYTSATRQRTYTRWCANGTWSAWKCDTDVVVYGSVTADSPKTFAYATYGEGFGVVEIEAYYDNATNPVRNRKVFALSPTASIERVMLTISNGSSESVTLANGSITMSMTGTTALSFMIRYTNSR